MTAEDKVRNTIQKHRMLSEGERVLISLSGGPDSVCLVYLLKKLQPSYNLALHAVYLNHKLRPQEIPEEISFCEKFCKELDIDFLVHEIDVQSSSLVKKMGKQAAARQLRYAALEDIARRLGAQKIAVGHQKNDQAETLIINLLRGAGMKGLSSIPPVRGKIIRPLITVAKNEILQYLSSQNRSYLTDSSNLRQDYLRNQIRYSLLPELKEFNPHIIETLSHTSDIVREENEYIETEVNKTLMRLFSRKTPSRVELFLSPLERVPTVILRRILRRAIAELKGLKSVSYQHIEDIASLIKKGKSGDRLYLPNSLKVIREYSVLIFTTEKPVRLKNYLLEEDEDLLIHEANIILRARTTDIPEKADGRDSAFFDRDKINLPLNVRARTAGDYFFPSGFGKRKKIQDFFVDEKIPRDERDSIPLVCNGNDIMWVFGYRTDQRYTPDNQTMKFFTITSRLTKK